jgi:putative aldouronate transport system substrate-binding protein
MDKEAFIQEESQLKQLVDGDICLVGSVPAGYPGCFADLNGENHKQFTAISPLLGPDGVQLAGYFPTQTSGASFVMTKDNAYPVETYKWADFNLGLEAHYRTSFGEEDVDWRYAEPGEVGLDMKESSAKFKEINYLTAGSTPQNKLWSHFFPVWTTNTQFIGRVSDPEDVWYLEARLYKETSEKYMGYDPEETIPSFFMELEDATEYSNLKAPLNTYMLEAIAKFSTNEWDIENDWDDYIAEFEKLEVERYLALIQKYYDAYKN